MYQCYIPHIPQCKNKYAAELILQSPGMCRGCRMMRGKEKMGVKVSPHSTHASSPARKHGQFVSVPRRYEAG